MPYNAYSGKSLAAAMDAVKSGRMSQRKAAKTHGIPQATLSDHLRGRSTMGVKARWKTVLPKEIEDQLVEEALDAADKAFGLSRVQLMMRAGRLAKEANLKIRLEAWS